MAMGVPIFEKLLMFPILYPNLGAPYWFPKITGMVSPDFQMGRIGVTITSSFILIPEKSVTAISGICG
jgi:hypothetical protein